MFPCWLWGVVASPVRAEKVTVSTLCVRFVWKKNRIHTAGKLAKAGNSFVSVDSAPLSPSLPRADPRNPPRQPRSQQSWNLRVSTTTITQTYRDHHPNLPGSVTNTQSCQSPAPGSRERHPEVPTFPSKAPGKFRTRQTQKGRVNQEQPPYLEEDLTGPEISELCESSSERKQLESIGITIITALQSSEALQHLNNYYLVLFLTCIIVWRNQIFGREWKELLSPPRSFHLAFVRNSSMSFTSSGRSSMNSATCTQHSEHQGLTNRHNSTPHNHLSPAIPGPLPRSSSCSGAQNHRAGYIKKGLV